MLTRVKTFFKNFLSKGLSPEKLALCVGLGVAIGIIPVLGSTTLLCALAAFAFGLNLPAIQSVNYVIYPLQFLLLIPFYHLGAILFHVPKLEITGEEVRHLLSSGILNAIHTLWDVTMHALAAWCIVAPLLTLLLYLLLTPAFRRLTKTH